MFKCTTFYSYMYAVHKETINYRNTFSEPQPPHVFTHPDWPLVCQHPTPTTSFVILYLRETAAVATWQDAFPEEMPTSASLTKSGGGDRVAVWSWSVRNRRTYTRVHARRARRTVSQLLGRPRHRRSPVGSYRLFHTLTRRLRVIPRKKRR